MQTFDVIAVIPVGPDTKASFICDTIDSLIYYTSSSYKIILVDDSHQGIGEMVKKGYHDIDVICTKKTLGSMAGLYITLSMAFNYVLEQYDFKLLFKLDTDALVIGEAPEQEAMSFFKKNAATAIAGQYPLDYDGYAWDTAWPRARIINGTMTWKFIKHPVANIVLRKLYIRALNNGYRTGESVFGGAYFMSKAFVQQLQEKKLLPDRALRTLNLGEDHLFALLARAMGFDLGDLSGKNLPFGCARYGLPASPEQLLKDQKKIIHSTRSWQHMNEEQIRTYFKDRRREKVVRA